MPKQFYIKQFSLDIKFISMAKGFDVTKRILLDYISFLF